MRFSLHSERVFMNGVTPENIIIRHYHPGDSISQLTALLHEAYGELARMGLRFLATHQDESVTLDRITSGVRTFVARQGEAIVGTLTLYGPYPASSTPWYRKPTVFHFGQFAVRPGLQGQGIGLQMLRLAEEEARTLGATELALDTAEPAEHLRQWYQRLGFRFIEYVQWDVTNYRSVILSKRLVGD